MDNLKKVWDKASDYSGSKSRKIGKGILGVVVIIILVWNYQIMIGI
jgi:hypothetical protein